MKRRLINSFFLSLFHLQQFRANKNKKKFAEENYFNNKNNDARIKQLIKKRTKIK